jgi:serine/threonine-protein kinase
MLEAQSSAALRSTHIVQVFDFGVDGGVPYIAMELLPGESLGARLDRVGTLSPGETLRIMTEAARAVAHAHNAGIVHRDLKPDNVFLVREGNAEITKVLDFGIAKVTGNTLNASTGGSTRTGALLGTPYYVSPEQARGNKAVDHRSDLWALGVIVYECMVGAKPFSSDGLGDLIFKICGDPHPPASSRGRVPSGFDAWMARALAKEPEQRFQSAIEMFDALAALLSQEVVPEPSLTDGAVAPARSTLGAASTTNAAVVATTAAEQPRRRTAAIVASAAGVGTVLAAGVLWWTLGPSGGELADDTTPSAMPVMPAAAPVALEASAPLPSPAALPDSVGPAPSVAPAPTVSAEPPASPAPARAAPRPAAVQRRPKTVQAPEAAPARTGTKPPAAESTAAKRPAGEELFGDRR